jgi:hypothetical protein
MDAFAQNKESFAELEASSTAVGLPEGLMGNSEVGHLNIGAGRVVYQDVVRIGRCRMSKLVTYFYFLPAEGIQTSICSLGLILGHRPDN